MSIVKTLEQNVEQNNEQDDEDAEEIEDANQWINWIEEAIAKEYFRYYEYKHFSNKKEIGKGGFGKVFRVNWKNNMEQYLVLKSFIYLSSATIKEIVHELKLHREVQHHSNIISFYGITKSDSESQTGKLKNYMLVMEYADGGSLRGYLKKNFINLTWSNKYNLAYQLANAVSYLHNEGIVHRDLHSGNVLINQDVIKLADFGLSKRIEESSKFQSKLFGVVPYIDPKKFTRNKDNDKNFALNEKSDVYSIGVLFWEISSGRPPFFIQGEQYDIGLALDISQGHRERPIIGTPEGYVKLYTECWDGEPSKRPTINQVLEKLRKIDSNNTITEVIDDNFQSSEFSSYGNSLSISNPPLGELSHVIDKFNDMDTKDMFPNLSKSTKDPTKSISTSKFISNEDLKLIVKEVAEFISKITNEGREPSLRKRHILDYFQEKIINLPKLYNWLLKNQSEPNSIFLLGYFNWFGIGTAQEYKEAFKYFNDPLMKDSTLAPYYVGLCYLHECGVNKNVKLAFQSFEKSAKENCAAGQINMGYCYYTGTGVKKDLKKAVSWYEKAVDNGNIMARYNLGLLYLNGNGTDKDQKKAFELFKSSAEGEYSGGISMLGYCYNNGIGTDVDKKLAFESYKKAANLGNNMSQYHLAKMYEKGEGVEEDLDEAIEWYKKSASQGDSTSEMKVKKLLKHKNRKSKDFCKVS